MKKFSLTKMAAIACSAVSVLALGAIFASAADQPQLKGQEITLTLDELKAQNYEVKWGVELTGNPGYTNSGASITYADGLTVKAGSNGMPVKTKGPAGGELTLICQDKPEDHLLGWATNGAEICADDGVIVTFTFVVPQTAKEGDKWEMELALDSLSTDQAHHFEDQFKGWDSASKKIAKELGGYIQIAGETTTSTTTTTTSTTTTTETTTTTTETTTSLSSTTTSTASTTTTTGTTKATTGTTKATTAATTAKTAGTKTGDAGVALAVAGMLAAAGTAIVLRKKED